MLIGLRIDVDTFRGTRYGVPNLCRILADHSIRATYFFSVGPDNMGRHLRQLVRPSFFKKMLRSKASNLYGWDILLKGTFWPGPVIGKKLGYIIRSASDAGHEAGFHAWDHYEWQAHMDHMDSEAIQRSLNRGVLTLTGILGHPPVCSAVPAWKCNDLVLKEKTRFPFFYNSDCRGKGIFYPVVNGKPLSQPQIPVTLPTYDEVIGHNRITNSNYNDYMISLLRPEKINVLTVHAEVEGISCAAMFDDFLGNVQSIGASFSPLGELLTKYRPTESCAIVAGKIPGRYGWVSFQAPLEINKEDC
ncbi:MAG: 4-deoxy-4-formamido-L-arabinose-phosphoundecaprenol deformylase [bacterium]